MNGDKAAIETFFRQARLRVYGLRELERLLKENREAWGISRSFSTSRVIEQMVAEKQVTVLRLNRHDGQKLSRYVLGRASPYEVALSLRRRAYLSHGTAVFLHGLNDQLPKTIYLNCEQAAKGGRGALSQEGLDWAFGRRQRMSSYSFTWGQHRVLLISGKFSNRLGVGEVEGPDGERLDATKLERTLIDIVVRPSYAGGIFQVVEAYKTARNRVSMDLLIETLRKLDYLYPYHQAIGFVTERAGYERSRVSGLREMGLDFDFYLVHGMKARSYDPRWRLFYPEGM